MARNKKSSRGISEPARDFVGKLIEQPLSEEIQRSYLDYAMSVIVSRALPDVRDGLKPVARRILYSMWRQNLRSTAKFRKSAHVVGDVMARYHPHGDLSIYDALARLTQDFSLRYPLVQGQGNWGSVDGDRPAAMRYTEARLMRIADEMLGDIEKQTVKEADSYDASRKEPTVLPSRVPQFLVNGTIGIAVGMATNAPPHNLKEVCDAAVFLIDHPNASVTDLMNFIQGPDFPTGGAIYGKQEIIAAYATGRGSIVTRALADIDEDERGGHRIIVREIPYLVNKANLIARIAEGVKNERIGGIRDLRDESDKDGVRIVIELKRDAYPKKVLNQLFATTDLQRTFHVNMLALVENGRQPKVLTLKDILDEHIRHRKDVITKRTQFELDRAKERAHILEGLQTALDHIDEVVATIKQSKTKEAAHGKLKERFGLSDVQATAILDMRLSTLSGLERKKVEDELKEKRKLISELTAILRDPKMVLTLIKNDYASLVQRFGDERRTRVFAGPAHEFTQEDLVPDDPTVVMITRGGYIKRMATDTYQVQRRGGRGVRGMVMKEEDVVDIVTATTTHTQLLFFTNLGRVFSAKAYEIPSTARAGKGQGLANFLELGSNETVTAMEPLHTDKERGRYLVMATKRGIIKKTSREDFVNIRRSGLRAITLNSGDELGWVSASGGNDEIMLISRHGQAIRFLEKRVRSMGRTARGVRGMKLSNDDDVVSMFVFETAKAREQEVLVITQRGFGKRTSLAHYRVQGRGGRGIKTAKVGRKTGTVVRAALIESRELTTTDVLIISQKGQVIRIPADSISKQGRATQGVTVMRPSEKSGAIATFTSWVRAE